MALRLGYVGCGFMAQKVHIPNFASLPGAKLVALAEVRPGLLKRVADRYGVEKRYASHLEMASREKLDAVAISAGYAEQGQFAMEFLRRGIPVFIEKPMATARVDAEAMLAAAREGGLPERRGLFVAYMKRYDGGNLVAREAIREFRQTGQMGKMIFARAHGFGGDWIGGLDTPFETSDEPIPAFNDQFKKYPEWLPAKWHMGYLGFLQQYTHNINLLRWLLDAGDDVKVDFADFEMDGPEMSVKGVQGLTVLKVAGVRTSLESGSMTAHTWDEHTQVYFENGYVKTSSPSLLLKNLPAEVEVYKTKPAAERSLLSPAPAYTWAYKREAEAFVYAVANGQPFDSSGEDTLADVRLYEEIYRAFLQRRGEI